MITTEALQNTDAMFSSRFEKRLRLIFIILPLLHALLIAFYVLSEGLSVYASWNIGTLLLAYAIILFSKDIFATIIFTHVYWTFSFATYVYALANWQSSTFGFEAENLTANIAFASQCGLFFAFIISGAWYKTIRVNYSGARLTSLVVGSTVPIILGFFGVALSITNAVPPVYSSTLRLFLFLGLGLRVLRFRLKVFTDPLSMIALLLAVGQSLLSNGRTDLLSMIFFFGVAAIVAIRKFTAIKFLVGYLAWRFMSVFSMVLLVSRYQYNLDHGSVAQSALRNFFSIDALWTFLNPAYKLESYQRAASGDNPMRSRFFTSGDGISDRLVVSPYLDKLLSRFGEFHTLRSDDIWNTFKGALPFGQDKMLVFSDQLTWELGFRAFNNVGRPMITAEGELYAMGGLYLVALFIGAMFLFQYLAYRITVSIISARVPTILLYTQFFINTIFSTTALSVLMGTVRAPLQLIFATLLLTLALPKQRIFSKRSNGNATPLSLNEPSSDQTAPGKALSGHRQ